ncbi:DUF1189 domain-containing protein, partial [Patescibacteria group bacterium]|nr:DUF1189 domain-containing protein [Patescibacteria group bacterium]
MKNFFSDFKNSFYGPLFYAQARAKSLGAAIGFLLLSALLTSFVLVFVFAASVIPGILSEKPAEFVEKNYPSELTVTIQDGKASTNVEQPYIIPIAE